MGTEERRTNRTLSVGAALRARLGRPIPPPDKPGHWSAWTVRTKCAWCGNEFTTRQWIWGGYKLTATICNPCGDRRDATKERPPAASQPEPPVKTPYKDD